MFYFDHTRKKFNFFCYICRNQKIMIVQKINTTVKDSEELAFKYFNILSIINDMEMVKRDVQLIAYAIGQKKDVSEIKVEFVEKFGSSMATVGNIISKLYKLKVLKKNKRVVSVNPKLLFDFEQELALGISFKWK